MFCPPTGRTERVAKLKRRQHPGEQVLAPLYGVCGVVDIATIEGVVCGNENRQFPIENNKPRRSRPGPLDAYRDRLA